MASGGIILSHPTGTPFAAHAAGALAEAQLLHQIATCFNYSADGVLARLIANLPAPMFQRLDSQLRRRQWIKDSQIPLKMHPLRETVRMILTISGLQRGCGIRYQSLVDWVYRSHDKNVARSLSSTPGLSGVYAYEDGAADSFAAAKALGLRCLYDLPIAYYQTSAALQLEESQRFPELASALHGADESPDKIRRKQFELQTADHVFVASSFTKQTLTDAGFSESRTSVIPYGVDATQFSEAPRTDKVFRVIFVGRVGPRKGVHYLIEAWRALKLPDAELLLVGVNEFPAKWLASALNDRSIKYLKSVPHHQLVSYYQSADVLVLPSLVEGFGMVLLEAMACGRPVIATPHTAAPDLISEGVEGFVVGVRDHEALAAKIEWLFRNRSELQVMGQAARVRAERSTWARYRSALAAAVNQVLSGSR